METKRRNQLLRKRTTNAEVTDELKYLMTRAEQVQAEVNKSIAEMVELVVASPQKRAFLNSGIGILEEYISSIVQCGEDADELTETRRQQLAEAASKRKKTGGQKTKASETINNVL